MIERVNQYTLNPFKYSGHNLCKHSFLGTSPWKLGFKCHHSELDAGTGISTIFEGNNGYNLNIAKSTCSEACEAREDCRFADLYYSGTENQSCSLHGSYCSDWRSSQHPLTAVYVKGIYPLTLFIRRPFP